MNNSGNIAVDLVDRFIKDGEATKLMGSFKDVEDIVMGDNHSYPSTQRVQVSYTYSKSRFNQQDIITQTKLKNDQLQQQQQQQNATPIKPSTTTKSSPKKSTTTTAPAAPAKKVDHHNRDHQFNKIYTDRLEKLRPVLEGRVTKKWPTTPLCKILHVKPGDECVIIGTVYKDMTLKPNILKQYASDRAILPVPAQKKSYLADNDQMLLEDETGRVKLICKQNVTNDYLTGLNVAIRGKCIQGSEFEVEEILEAGLPPQPFHSNDIKGLVNTVDDNDDDVFVCLMSGISVGNPNNELVNSLLLDYLTGNLGSPNDQKLVSKIARVIIAGNSVYKEKNVHELRFRSKQEIAERQQKIAIPIKELDMFLTELCQSIPTDILPGENDPSNLSLPQMPLNYCLFPFTVQNTNINPVTNPYEAEIGGKIFLGSSGQNIDNADRYMNVKSKIDLLEKTLNWRHMAPTAPDTLACAPLEIDPFIIEQCPHVYFIGNGDCFETKFIEGPSGETVRIIQVPSFTETHQIVLVNIKTLETIPISFNSTKYFPQSPNLTE